jgi:hypothetical protein
MLVYFQDLYHELDTSDIVMMHVEKKWQLNSRGKLQNLTKEKKNLGIIIHCDKHMACMLTRDNYIDVDLLSITTNPFLHPRIKVLYYCKVQRQDYPFQTSNGFDFYKYKSHL